MSPPASLCDIKAGKSTPEATEEELAYSITVHAGKQTELMDYSHAFALAHDLLRQQKALSAAAVLLHLVKVASTQPAAHILLAISYATVDKYSTCLKVLNNSPQLDKELAGLIFRAIVHFRVDSMEQVIHEVRKLAKDHQQLPEITLWLGDLYENSGSPERAIQCWRVAAARDRADGAVSLAARRQIVRLKKFISTCRGDTPELTGLVPHAEMKHAT